MISYDFCPDVLGEQHGGTLSVTLEANDGNPEVIDRLIAEISALGLACKPPLTIDESDLEYWNYADGSIGVEVDLPKGHIVPGYVSRTVRPRTLSGV